MKIAIIGGGPAGLYSAILLKKQRPEAEITVYERNRADDTFGFGVVFSDATLDNFEKYDAPSYRRITEQFAYWDDIAVHFRGTVHRVGGNGFCGCSRRTLLLILQERARELGVALLFEADIEDEARFADADLVVLADGINSRFRDKYIEHFQPEVDLRSNKFAWMGSTRPLDAFTFIFQETEWGPFIAHAYQYEAGRSTWIFETDPETFKRAGLEGLNEKQSADRMARDFRLVPRRPSAPDQPLDVAQFPDDPQQALGQGQHGAAGRRQGDRAFLDRLRHQARDGRRDCAGGRHASRADGRSGACSNTRTAAARRSRRPSTPPTCRWSGSSMSTASGISIPVQFAFGVMTRAKAITYDNLTLRAPDFVAEVDKAFAKQVRAKGFDVDVEKPVAPMFQPLRLREMTLANRAVVSPMCMYSAKEGVPGDFHLVHYGSRAIGGAGLIFTEMTCVGRDARITPGCAGLWNDEQQAAWRRIVDFVHANSAAKIALQLGHAGRKGATKLMWDGMDRPLEQGGWDVISASPIPYFPDSQVPREMDRAAMDAVKAAFVAGRRARRSLRLRHAGAALRPRLSAREFHLAADQPAHRCLWRLARQPPALSAGSVRGVAGGVAGAQADVGAHFRHRLGRGRHHRRRRGRDRARLCRGRRRSGRCLHRADRARRPAGLWPHVPDAVLRAGPQRGARRHHVRRQHHDRGPGQYHPRRRPRRSGGARPAASGRSRPSR